MAGNLGFLALAGSVFGLAIFLGGLRYDGRARFGSHRGNCLRERLGQHPGNGLED